MVVRCVSCNEPMKPHFAKDGVAIFICPNTRLTIKKQNLVPYGYMFCGHKISKETQDPIIYDMKECVQLHAEFVSLKTSFDAITESLTLGQLKLATHNTLSDIEILKSANLALMLGLKEEQLCELFESGLKLGYALGTTAKYAIFSLSKGISRQSKLILDNIGISFQARTASAWYAKEHSLEKLDAEQKREAWKQYAIKLVIEKGKPLKIGSELAKRDQLKAKIENLKVQHGREGL